MIIQLVRTRFESNLHAFIIFLGMNGFLLWSVMTMENAMYQGEFHTLITASLLSICLGAGAISALRFNREKHSRLYAQLPVSSLQIRVAYWCHAGLYLGVSALMLLLIMLHANSLSPLELLLFTLLYFFHAGVLLAVVSIITTNNLRLIPERIRKLAVIYYVLCTVIIVLFLFGVGLLAGIYERVYHGGVENWFKVTVFMLLFCAALVMLDIHLFRKKDNYLG